MKIPINIFLHGRGNHFPTLHMSETKDLLGVELPSTSFAAILLSMQATSLRHKYIAACSASVAKEQFEARIVILDIRMDGLHDKRGHCRFSLLATRVVLNNQKVRYTKLKVSFPRLTQTV